MALLDVLRYAVNAVNNATGNPAFAQFRDYSVAQVLESAAVGSTPVRLGTPGATYTRTTLFTVTPSVDVNMNPSPGDPSWQGGGLQTQSTGVNVTTVGVVGPIAQAYTDPVLGSGGYTAAQLSPAESNPMSRHVYVLNGPDLPALSQYGGVPFKLVWLWQPDPQTWKMTLMRAEEFP